jgi:hypothetical protein
LVRTQQNESVSPSVGKTQATEENDNKVLDGDMTEPAKDFSIDSQQTRESRVKSRMISMEIDLERNGYTNDSNEEEKNEVDVSNRTNRSQTLSSRIRSVSSVFNPLVVVKSNEQFETSSMNGNVDSNFLKSDGNSV